MNPIKINFPPTHMIPTNNPTAHLAALHRAAAILNSRLEDCHKWNQQCGDTPGSFDPVVEAELLQSIAWDIASTTEDGCVFSYTENGKTIARCELIASAAFLGSYYETIKLLTRIAARVGPRELVPALSMSDYWPLSCDLAAHFKFYSAALDIIKERLSFLEQ